MVMHARKIARIADIQTRVQHVGIVQLPLLHCDERIENRFHRKRKQRRSTEN